MPLPRALNDEAVRAGSEFLQQAAEHHERFLAMAFVESFGTLDWLRNKAAGRYDVRELGAFDGVKVMEFVPREETVTRPMIRRRYRADGAPFASRVLRYSCEHAPFLRVATTELVV